MEIKIVTFELEFHDKSPKKLAFVDKIRRYYISSLILEYREPNVIWF